MTKREREDPHTQGGACWEVVKIFFRKISAFKCRACYVIAKKKKKKKK